MDKKAWFVITLCVFGIIFNQLWTASKRAPHPPQQVSPSPTTPQEEQPVVPSPSTPQSVPEPVPQIAAAETPDAATQIERDHETYTLQNAFVKYVFTNIGGGVAQAELLQHVIDGGKPLLMNRYGEHPLGALSTGVGKIDQLVYTLVEKTETTLTLAATTAQNVEIRKTYSLVENTQKGSGYLLDFDISFTNKNQDTVKLVDHYLYTGRIAPIQDNEWSYQIGFSWVDGEKAEYESVDYFKGKNFIVQWSPARDFFSSTAENLKWVGINSQFYCSILSAKEPTLGKIWAKRFPVELPDSRRTHFGIESAFGLPEITLAPGETKTCPYQAYMGPKSYLLLKELGGTRAEIMHYGNMPILGWIFGWMVTPMSKILMVGLVKIQGWVHNYGIAIIILTLIIRLLIWPLYNKSNRTMKRMSLLQPKLKELREKHKEDPQKLNQEMMKMYREYGINPLGGCLPVLIQMPIFLGFYRMLISAVELRHQGFLWVDDLSQPDTVGYLAGFPINVLPLLMGATMIIQMKLTPKSGDKMQQRIFMFMPLIFLIICYNFASALALYWTFQNIFSIGQMYINKLQPEPILDKKPVKKKVHPLLAQNTYQKPKKKKNRPARTGG